MSTVLVNICENDKCGNRSGLCQQMIFFFEKNHEKFMHIECRYFEGVPIKQHAERIIEMYGSVIKFYSCSTWTGNIFWNQYNLPLDYPLGFINLLMRKQDFTISQGYTEIYQKWNAGKEIIASDLDMSDEFFKPTILNPNQLNIFK